MAYTNKVSATAGVGAVAVATMVLFLAVTVSARRTHTQAPPTGNTDTVLCELEIPEIVKNCYAKLSLLPSEECCNDLKTASKTEVTCLCDNFIASPSNGNTTKAYFNQVNTACGVLDKYACSNGGDANRGARRKIVAFMGLFGLVAYLFF